MDWADTVELLDRAIPGVVTQPPVDTSIQLVDFGVMDGDQVP
jgi:hypothetical protein